MTSTNLSWIDKVKANKKIMSNRNMWSNIIVLPLMFIVFIIPMLLFFIRSASIGMMRGQTAEQMLYEKQMVVLRAIGLNSEFYVLVCALGVIYAFAKFSYLFSTSKLDFYLSLPTTSARRVQSAYMVAITNFAGIYLFVVLFAYVISIGFGAVNTAVTISVLIQTARMLILFLASFSLTTLAIMLCGTKVIAIMFTGCLMIFPYIFGILFDRLREIFYATSSGVTNTRFFLCPLLDVIEITRSLERFDYYSIRNVIDVPTILGSYFPLIGHDIDMLITAIVATVMVMVVYRYRRAEHVGKTIVYKPIRWIVKIIVCIICSLTGILFIYYIFDKVRPREIYCILFIAMLAICVLTGSLVEICLDMDIKSFSKGKRQTLMAMAILVLIYIIYRGDLLGYDSYIPDSSGIESISISNLDYDFGSCEIYELYGFYSGSGTDSFSNKNMKLTDIDTAKSVIKIGMDYAKKIRKDRKFYGWQCLVSYDLKNGKEVNRKILIPYDIDVNLMDKLTGNEEYIKGHIPAFDEEFFDVVMSDEAFSIRYDDFMGDYNIDQVVSAKKLIEAYRQDVLDNYKFSFTRNNSAIGELYLSSVVNGDSCYSMHLMVYDGFTRTVDCLKLAKAYTDQNEISDKIKKITIRKDFIDYDFDTTDELDSRQIYLNNYYGRHQYDGGLTITYTDPKKIKEILSNAEYYFGSVDWRYPYDNMNMQYSIEVNDNTRDVFTCHFKFKKNSVPKFVVEDFSK